MLLRNLKSKYTICKDLGSSLTFDQGSFPPIKMFLHSKIKPNAKICAMCSNNLA